MNTHITWIILSTHTLYTVHIDYILTIPTHTVYIDYTYDNSQYTCNISTVPTNAYLLTLYTRCTYIGYTNMLIHNGTYIDYTYTYLHHKCVLLKLQKQVCGTIYWPIFTAKRQNTWRGWGAVHMPCWM